jgi:peptidoglycan/LPS O-acetylase OafA/YrhL
MPPTPTRFDALDGWRGVCACLVALFHFHGNSPVYTSDLVRNSYLFVDFFFVLSGFVIAWNYEGRVNSWPAVRRFVVLRLGRVYPLHLFMLFSFLAYETFKLVMGMGRANPPPTFTGETEPFAVLTNLLLIHSLNIHDTLTWNGPSWSISTELWAYVIFALVSLWFGLRRWMLAAAALVAPLVLLQVTTTGMDVTYDYGLVRCVFGFALGIACSRLYRHMPQRFMGHGLALMTVLECLAVLAVVLYVAAAGKSSWSLLAPFVFAIAVLVFAAEGGWISRLFSLPLLKWLGMLSYSIYMTHYFIVLTLPTAIKHGLGMDLWRPVELAGGEVVQLYGRNATEGTLLYVLVVVLTLAFSAFTYRWVETPGRDWSRRWAGKPAARASIEPARPQGGQLPSP